MTATNHTLAGAIIGASIANPVLALLLALVSHLLLDLLPHFGKISIKTRQFKLYLGADIALASLVLLGILIVLPANWLLIIACGVIAASPDLLSFPRWLAALKNQKYTQNKLQNFLGRIQWGETKRGLIFEIPFAIAAAITLVKLLHI